MVTGASTMVDIIDNDVKSGEFSGPSWNDDRKFEGLSGSSSFFPLNHDYHFGINMD